MTYAVPVLCYGTYCNMLKEFMGGADPHDCYVIKTGL